MRILSNRLMALCLIPVCCVVFAEFAWNTLFFLEARDDFHSMRISFETIPATNLDYDHAKISSMESIGWDRYQLISLSNDQPCKEVNNLPNTMEILARRYERYSLLFYTERTASVRFRDYDLEIEYSDGWPAWFFSIPRKELDLANLPLDSDAALDIAERNGGAALRSSLNNDCRIGMTIDTQEMWIVEYYQLEDTSKGILRFIIDPNTGDVQKR